MEPQKFKSISSVIKESMTLEALGARPVRISTGFPQLDAYLGGGLTPGLTILGAGPSSGKSTFAVQMAQHIAASQIPVLYFSLEMKNERIAAKLISRYMFSHNPEHKSYKTEKKATEQNITADCLFREDAQQEIMENHQQQFEKAYQILQGLKYLFVQEGYFSAEDIYNEAWRFHREGIAKQLAGAEEPAYTGKPLIIVDYLQILAPSRHAPQSDKQAVDYNLRVLKKLTDGIDKDGNAEEGFPVILISSLNRSNYGGRIVGPIQMESFKETGGIEYSADTLLGLQFSACNNVADPKTGKLGCDVKTEKQRFPRLMEIVCLKQRYGITQWSVPYRYYAPFDCFVEIAQEDQPEEAQAGINQQEALCAMINCKMFLEMRRGAEIRQMHDTYSSGAGQKATAIQYMITPNLTWTVLSNLLAALLPEEADRFADWGTIDQQQKFSRKISQLLLPQIVRDKGEAPFLYLTPSVLETICSKTYNTILPDVPFRMIRKTAAKLYAKISFSYEQIAALVESFTPDLTDYLKPPNPEATGSGLQIYEDVAIRLAGILDHFSHDRQQAQGKICDMLYTLLVGSDLILAPSDCVLTDDTWQMLMEVTYQRQQLVLPLMADLTRQLTCSDYDVMDAIYTLFLWNSRSESFTLGQIHQVLTGNRSRAMTKKQTAEIRTSLEKLVFTDLYLDATAERAVKSSLKKGEKWVRTGPLLVYTESDMTYDRKQRGQEDTVSISYKVMVLGKRTAMPLFDYLPWNTQIIYFPQQLLAVREVNEDGIMGKLLPDTATMIKLKRYLIHRLEVIRGARQRGSKVNMQTIHLYGSGKSNDPGLLASIDVRRQPWESNAVWNNRISAIESSISAILRYYREVNYIEGYTEELDPHRNLTGFTITGPLQDPAQLDWERK